MDEQQFPKVEVRQVALVSELEPQFPSVLVGFEARDMREILETISCRLTIREGESYGFRVSGVDALTKENIPSR